MCADVFSTAPYMYVVHARKSRRNVTPMHMKSKRCGLLVDRNTQITTINMFYISIMHHPTNKWKQIKITKQHQQNANTKRRLRNQNGAVV